MKKIIVANWKMNPQSTEEARKLFMSTEHRMHYVDGMEVIICAPFMFLPMLAHHLHHVKLAAQNVSSHDSGAYTGETSANQLKNWNITHVILGHSERRIYFDETDPAVREKINQALKHHLTPIVCLGGEKDADEGRMKPLVTKQFNSAIADLDKRQIGKLIFVYEPTWAISTQKNSKVASGEHAFELIGHIRMLLSHHVGIGHAQHMPVLYGGTVNKNNVDEFAKFPGISGALVGAASLDADNFWEVIKEFNRESIHRS